MNSFDRMNRIFRIDKTKCGLQISLHLVLFILKILFILSKIFAFPVCPAEFGQFVL